MANGRIGSQSLSIAIYMEGGGQGRDSKAALRQGMDNFLVEIKSTFRANSRRWKLVCCGGRNEAFKGFRHACDNGDDGIVVLLVDAEGPVSTPSPAAHLVARDGWDIDGIDDDTIHLMVQTMEAWIVADRSELRRYYGQHFRANALPGHQNLEDVHKDHVERALNRATERTQKGRYHKIRHASDLLSRIDPTVVRQRCSYCERLFETLLRLAGEGG